MRVIRKLSPLDSYDVRRHYDRLDPASHAYRFFGRAPSSFLDDHAIRAASFRRLAVGCFVEGHLRAVGELATPQWPMIAQEADLALSVEPTFQGQGIGGDLIERLLVVASNRGIHRIRAETLWHNARMRSLLKKYRARPRRISAVLEMELVAGLPTAWTLWRESLGELNAIQTSATDALFAVAGVRNPSMTRDHDRKNHAA